MKPISEWETKEIQRWMYAIGERSDRVISRAMEDEDWSEYESDERLHNQLEAELMKRGLYANGNPIPAISPEKEVEVKRLLEEGNVYEAQKLILSEFDQSTLTASDNPSSEG